MFCWSAAGWMRRDRENSYSLFADAAPAQELSQFLDSAEDIIQPFTPFSSEGVPELSPWNARAQ